MLSNDLRIGRVAEAAPAEGLHKPAYILTIDLGPELGTRTSSAQLTLRYTPEDLVGRLVICVCDLPPRQVGRYLSEVLVLGVDVPDDIGGVALLAADASTTPGTPVY
ncbi:MAG: hypothetical protein MK085_08885 [Phycisphaerales bacterium]|nr:hypothetical protein [Phycisphaerales bacterium]